MKDIPWSYIALFLAIVVGIALIVWGVFDSLHLLELDAIIEAGKAHGDVNVTAELVYDREVTEIIATGKYLLGGFMVGIPLMIYICE